MKNLLTLVAVFALACTGCKTKLESGGAYAPATFSADAAGAVSVTPKSAPQLGLYVADAAYKLAYDIVDGVLKFERDNRADVEKISPKIKIALDAVRPVAWDIDQRWAKARQMYQANPTPAGLSNIQTLLLEIQRLIPVVQEQIAPVFSTLAKSPLTP
jgi:hypothetical protein